MTTQIAPHSNATGANSGEVESMDHAARHRCFGCGPQNPIGLGLTFADTEPGKVVGEANIPDTYEGAPGYVHGGIIATLLDEAMIKPLRALGVVAMTRAMEIDYLRPVPSETRIRLEGQIVRSEGRKFWSEGQVLDAEGTVLAQSKGLFIRLQNLPRTE